MRTAGLDCAEGTGRLTIAPSLFDELWTAQSGRCALCGEAMPRGRFDAPHATVWKKKRPTFDHIRPRKKGGTGDRANLQLAHAECNWRKGSSWSPAPR